MRAHVLPFVNMAENLTSQKVIDGTSMQEITAKLNSLYSSHGLEIYPFKIGWYNEQVDLAYRFSLPSDTLAYVVVSTPDMFENALVPFICRDNCLGSLDLLDKCMQHYLSLAKRAFPDEDVEVIHDFEMTPMRRAKVLVQPASHVAGAAYYYTCRALNPNPFIGKTVFGVCIHPKYGGWFAIRGVIIFRSIQSPDLPFTEPIDCVPDQADRVKLLDLFTHHWRDWRYRDIINVEKTYSEDQRAYFATPPKDRKPLIMELRKKYSKTFLNNKQIGCKNPETDIKKDNTVNTKRFSICNNEMNSSYVSPGLY